MTIQIKKLLSNDKALFLAYDQGVEHGPTDFNVKNCDPNYILDIALEGRYNAIILEHGTAEKYYQDYYKDIPLIVKLSAATSMTRNEPRSRQMCSVERAIKLGASGVGYVMYNGSEFEQDMMVEFSKIVDTAHDYGLPVVAWAYPRGKFVEDQNNTQTVAYATRIAAELGADIIKIRYNGDIDGLKWTIKNAGRAKVVIAGGNHDAGHEGFLKMVKEVTDAGAHGIAVGRNVWQDDKPFSLTKSLQSIIFHKHSIEEAKKFLK